MNPNIEISKHQKEVIPTEGEAYIKMHLDSERIKHVFQYDIFHLENDSDYSYRTSDFYLPRLKMFVEFNGAFNKDKETRERYKTKTKVYRENEVPCVQLYPKNLGNLEFSFHYRIMQELELRGMKW